MTAAEKARICKSYYMEELAHKIELGETPTSNRQIVKMLQSILDEMVFKADETNANKNAYLVGNADAAYIRATYTRKGKTALSVATAKHGYMLGLVMDVFHKVITDKKYKLEYQTTENVIFLQKRRSM